MSLVRTPIKGILTKDKKYFDNPHNLMSFIRQEFDNLHPNEVIWNPYFKPNDVILDDMKQTFQSAMCITTLIFDDIAEPYMSDYVHRQFRAKHGIPRNPIYLVDDINGLPSEVYKPISGVLHESSRAAEDMTLSTQPMVEKASISQKEGGSSHLQEFGSQGGLRDMRPVVAGPELMLLISECIFVVRAIGIVSFPDSMFSISIVWCSLPCSGATGTASFPDSMIASCSLPFLAYLFPEPMLFDLGGRERESFFLFQESVGAFK
ncbi:hypothetical protein AMTR_s00016p00254820 [Amborella trichopoda]|uniref:Aminotransferase-like plant mobile domain-containing protein n=1 Tax=Amborella trichopoda TaxID=13333 RepID=W1PH32_AMBTC|nr:hypothetical protein AMTR_s00016p00254820 [Amborella trichopoda]